MKNLFKITILVFALFWVRMTTMSAQAGNVGSWPPDVEIIEKCVDSLNLGTNYISFFTLSINRSGFARIDSNFRSNGVAFTPPAGKITIGMCPQSVSIVKDSIRDYEIFSLCDYDVGSFTSYPFFRIIQRTYWPTTGAGVINVVATLTYDGTPYTSVGIISDHPCWGVLTPSEVVEEITTNVTKNSVTGRWESWSISNVGTTIFQVNIGGTGLVNLYPGETRRCMETPNQPRGKTITCQAPTINASGGVCHFYGREHQ